MIRPFTEISPMRFFDATKESHMLKEIEGSSADVYKTLNAWIADFPVAPGFFGAKPLQ